MFCGDSGSSASNIITYIGVPLAVAGILPILYNFLATVATVHKVKGILQRSRLSASAIRSNIFNRVIELELPRYKLATFDREEPQYWEPQRQLSTITGGTWTALKWRTRHVATKVQRIQYADEIKQPQAEVEFDELISYLLDLGAIPDPRGWRVLRTNGVWTPKDHCLLSSPDSRNALLTVASLDDSDGHLSLKLNLSATWKRKSCGLPPRWVCLPSLTSPVPDRKVKLNASNTLDASRVPRNPHESPRIEENFSNRDTEISEKEEHDCMTATDCELSVNGLLQVAVHKACPHEPVANSSGGQNINSGTLVTEDHNHNHDIDHIRTRHGNSNGVWFASALAAYASASHTISWYVIPDEILRFTTKATVPCGVLVLLGILEDSDAPVWTTRNDDAKTGASQHLRRRDEQRCDMEAEARMPWEQRQDAFRDRLRRERQQWETDGEFLPLPRCDHNTYWSLQSARGSRRSRGTSILECNRLYKAPRGTTSWWQSTACTG